MNKISDKEYIARVYDETYLYITKYLVTKCRNTSDVSDLLQNIYMNFLTRINKRGQSHVLIPKLYLIRIAKDELSKYYRQKEESKESIYIDEEEFYDRIDESFLLEEFSENKLLYDEVWNLIKEFDDLTVKIFTLRFVYDMKLPEIAAETNCNLSAVKSRLYRGLEKIREFFDEKSIMEGEN